MTSSQSAGAIDALLSPRSIAVVGASERSYVGRVLCENLRTLGYEGAVYPVNPRYPSVMGWDCHPSLEDLPETPDAVVTAVSFERVPDVLRSAVKLGVRAAVVPGGGFTESGPVALEVEREISAIAGEAGMAVCGPNCMGVIRPPDRSALYIGTVSGHLLPGRVALVSQSGSIVEAAVNAGPRIGFSALVSCGNEAATTIGQYLRWFARDNVTNTVTLFIEGFRDPADFIAGARALRAAGKPLAVLLAGRSEGSAEAIAAHSGRLAGTDEVVTGLLHQLGAIGVDDLDELLEVAELLGHGQLPRGRRMVVLTDSGGEARLVADLARRLGLELPPPSPRLARRLQSRWPNFAYVGNPIDPWGVDADYGGLYREVASAAAEEDVDVVAVALDKVTSWAGGNETHLGEATARALVRAAEANPEKLAVYLTIPATGPAAASVAVPLRRAGIPLLHGLRPALVAIRRAWYWRQWVPRSPTAGDPLASSRPQMLDMPSAALREPGPILSERASLEILATYDVPVVLARAAGSGSEAREAAEELGYPVVMKADFPGVAHKAAAGLVELGVSGPAQVVAAFGRLMERAGRVDATVAAEPRGVLVEATARGVELICGMRHDPLFGPVVLIGAGGSLAEAIDDVAVRVLPAAELDFEEMLDECIAGRLIEAAGSQRAAVCGVLASLARLALDHPEIREVDVNPLFAGPQGVMAADALVVIEGDGKGQGQPSNGM